MRGIALVCAAALGLSLVTAGPVAAEDQAAQDQPVSVATAPTCSGVTNAASVASASGTITTATGSVAGARVYGYEMQTGALTCTTVTDSGTYSLPLPGATVDGTSTRPVDGWIVTVAPADAGLGGTSRLLTWDSVAVGGTVEGVDLVLGAAEVTVRVTAPSALAGAPVLVCSSATETLPGGPCGIGWGSGQGSVRLVDGRANSAVQAYAVKGITTYSGYGWSEAGNSVDVQLSSEEVGGCGDTPSVSGRLSRTVDGRLGGVKGQVALQAVWTSGGMPARMWIGGADAIGDGTYRMCVDPGTLGSAPQSATFILSAEALSGGVKTAQRLDRACLPSCTGIGIGLVTQPSVGGTVSFAGVAAGSPLPQRPSWTLYKGSIQGDAVSTQYDVTSGRTDALGRWGVAFAGGLAPLVDGTYVVEARPTSNAGGYVRKHAGLDVASSSGIRDFELPRTKLYGRVVNSLGVEQMWTSINFQETECTQSCRYAYAETDGGGWFSTTLQDGTYSVTAYPRWGETDGAITRFTAVVQGGEFTQIDGQPVTAPITLRLKAPNATFFVRQDDTVVRGATIQFGEWRSNSQGGASYDWRHAQATWNDDAIRSLLEPGSYRVTVYPGYDSSFEPIIEGWRVTGSGDSLQISRCVSRPVWWRDPCPADAAQEVFASSSPGQWIIALPEPRLIATITNPEADRALARAGACINYSWKEAGSGNTFDEGWCLEADESGEFGLRMADPGTYTVRVTKPWDVDENWAPATYQFEVASNGDICARVAADRCDPVQPGKITLPVAGANVIASVSGAGGSPLPYGWAQVSRGCGSDGCRQWVASSNLTRTGSLALRLAAIDDTYYVRVYPYGIDDGSVETTFQVRVTDDSTVQRLQWTLKRPNVTGKVRDAFGVALSQTTVQVERSVNSEWRWVDAYGWTDIEGNYKLLLDPGTYRLRVYPQSNEPARGVATTTASFTVADSPVSMDVSLRRPNLTGVIVTADDTPLANSWIEVQKWYPAYGYYGWSPEVSGGSTTNAGQFGLDLPSGQWRLIVNAPWGSMDVSRTIVPVISDGTGVCLDDGSPCGASDYLGNDYRLVMQRPNASGRVVMPDGSPLTSYAWIDIQKWSNNSQAFGWDFDLPGVTMGSRGAFALTLPRGRWKLTAHPDSRFQLGTRNSIDVTVDAGGFCLTTSAPCTGANAIAPGTLAIALRAPDLQGRVTAGGNPVANTWLYLTRWESTYGYWQWTNEYAYGDDQGRYIFTLDDTGTYRIMTPNHGRIRGYTDGDSQVVVTADGICEVPVSDPAVSTEGQCTGAIDDTIAVETTLKPANLVAVVTGDGVPVPWLWVQLQEKTDYGWSWRSGAPSSGDGGASLRVHTDDTTWLRLYVDPSWNNVGDFTRTYFDVIAYKDLSSGDVRTCALADWDPAGRTCAKPITLADPAMVPLSTGGLKATVTDPTGSAVAWTWVYTERWVEQAWNPGSYAWQWDDAYGYSRGNGNVSLPITGPGIFRLTTHPRWPNLEGYSRGTQIVKVEADGTWCLLGAASGTTANPFGDCMGAQQLQSARVPLALATSNVVGALVYDDGVTRSRGMPYGWITVYDQSGNWVTGVSTSDQGRFALRLDDGEYTVIGYPNWTFSQRPPVRSTLTVIGGQVTDGLTNGVALLDLDGVPPNVTLTLTGTTGQRLIAVQRDDTYLDNGVEITDNWVDKPEYNVMTGGGPTNRARLSLPEGRYRLSVVPEIGYEITGTNWIIVTVGSGQQNESISIVESELAP
jgi:hypothetical protein